MNDKRDIRPLCKNCRDNYEDAGLYYIRPVYRKNKKKKTCFRCPTMFGYDYELIPKDRGEQK